ncbi:MAG: MoaD/ThiS family protein [Rubripirellula sp.]
MDIEVLLFAAARESAGCDTICLEVPDQPVATDVLHALEQKLPELEGLLSSCRLAVDCQYVGPNAAIAAGAEVALIPPVSGG